MNIQLMLSPPEGRGCFFVLFETPYQQALGGRRESSDKAYFFLVVNSFYHLKEGFRIFLCSRHWVGLSGLQRGASTIISAVESEALSSSPDLATDLAADLASHAHAEL